MRQTALLLCFLSTFLSCVSGEEEEARGGKTLSVFNVVKFPNDACGASNGFNGTCYTSSECSSLGGTASGTCASSFGVCCVFSIHRQFGGKLEILIHNGDTVILMILI